jgi:hypothetical protein
MRFQQLQAAFGKHSTPTTSAASILTRRQFEDTPRLKAIDEAMQ